MLMLLLLVNDDDDAVADDATDVGVIGEMCVPGRMAPMNVG